MQRAVPPTPLGHLVFVLHTHLPWVLGHGRWPHGEAWLYEATAECYLPILRLLDRLEEEGRKGSITIGITPVLSEMLATPRFRDESVNAQLVTGIASYRRSFGGRPRGTRLPECAYRPGYIWNRPAGPARSWLRPGLEELLGRHGIGFFFVDSHLVAGGAPIGTYEDRFKERRLDAARDGTGLSPQEPYALSASGRRKVAILARDPRSSVQVWSADYGYPGDGAYLEVHRKHGMDGLRYWRVTDRQLPLREKVPYEPDAAQERAAAHADHFASLVLETLHQHQEATGRTGVVVAPFDTELFGHWWFEGPTWLEAVLRKLEGHVDAVTASDFLAAHPPRSTIQIPEGSWGQR